VTPVLWLKAQANPFFDLRFVGEKPNDATTSQGIPLSRRREPSKGGE